MSQEEMHSGAPVIRVAMVGSGQRAAEELKAMRRSGRAMPVGFWNRTPELAHARSRAEGLRAGFATVTEMIDRTSPDVVNIVTHPSARIPLLREAIDAGARVILLEKPIALTPDELAIVRAMGEEVFIAVNTQYRWMAHWQRFRQVIAEGELGDIRAIRVSTRADILEQGPHLMSLALGAARAAGLPLPSWVLAASDDDSRQGDVVVPADLSAVMDLGHARLQLLAGASAPWLPAEDNFFYQQQVEILGTNGRIWSSLTQGWTLSTVDGQSSGSTEWPRDDHQSQAALFADLACAVHDPSLRDDFPTSIQRAAEEARVLFAAIESGKRAGRVELVL